MNWLETQLKSWEPRHPSASIKRGLFPARTKRVELARAFAWFAPVTACLIFTLAVIGRETGPVALAGGQPLLAASLSNRILAARLPGVSGQIVENQVDRATLAWTTPHRSISSVGSMPFTISTN